MKNKILIINFLILFLFPAYLLGDEGMWIPLLIEKYNIKIMKEKGFKLSAEDIYSVNKACMKDAVLRFGGGCTGEIISGEGLLITNHHCGYGNIQKHSSLEHDYLRNGFWAMSRKEELPNPGLTITILKRMEDVTVEVLKGVIENMDRTESQKIINSNIALIENKAIEGTGYTAQVRPFYMGNQYFLFVNETFRDVRLVGAPPSSIGKFGGETDNWIWPRHTGDFSVFRIYADKNNKPADFSPDNIPYKPAYFFPISLKGVKEGDFTMVFGYPGSTSEYVPSDHIDMVKNYLNPKIIVIRSKKIEIMEAAMNTDPLIRIQYSAKKSGIANSWKKWQGEILGLNRMNTIEIKKKYESQFTEWVNSEDSRREKYGSVLPAYKKIYSSYKEYLLVNNYTGEVFNGAESFILARGINDLVAQIDEKAPQDEIQKAKDDLLGASENFFKDYNTETDRQIFEAVMTLYGTNIEEKWQSPGYIAFRKECGGDFASISKKLYSESIFTDRERFRKYIAGLNRSSSARLKKDKIYSLAMDASEFIGKNVAGELLLLSDQLQKLNKLYMAAQIEFGKNKVFYPDANSTLRITYGNIMGYKPKDAVYFNHFSTLNGIIEKDNPEIFDYDVPDKLKELYIKKDFGRYVHDGEVPVCFIANNHTTGGNSGSPVINADGQLIGINFDRAWEGVASDMAYNPEMSRNISLDIRYALFIIDKFAGAGYLLDEMKIVE